MGGPASVAGGVILLGNRLPLVPVGRRHGGWLVEAVTTGLR